MTKARIKNWKLFFVYGFICIVGLYCSFTLDIELYPSIYDSENLEISGYWNLINSPIFIDDLHPTDNWDSYASQYPWCTGKGTAGEPYIIQGVIVSSGDSDCITIWNSDAYFIIVDCIIFDSGAQLGAGIFLHNVINGFIIYSEIINNNDCGIKATESTDIFIYNNEIRGNKGQGIYMFKCSNSEIAENTISNNGMVGIDIFKSNNTVITDNEISSHIFFGIDLGFNTNTEIHNNIISNHSEGIYLYESRHNIISYNTVTNSSEFGILLQYNANNNTISENSFSNNRYCIGIGDDCVRNKVFNNGVCQIYTLDRALGPPPFDDDELIKNNAKDPIFTPGYIIIIILGSLIFLSILLLRSMRIIKR